MKKSGILNSDISRVLSYMGHTDTIAVGDCGLPVPEETERIDLALREGLPSFMDVLETVSADMNIEKIVLAEEIRADNPVVLERILALCEKLPLRPFAYINQIHPQKFTNRLLPLKTLIGQRIFPAQEPVCKFPVNMQFAFWNPVRFLMPDCC